MRADEVPVGQCFRSNGSLNVYKRVPVEETPAGTPHKYKQTAVPCFILEENSRQYGKKDGYIMVNAHIKVRLVCNGLWDHATAS